jgi:hypothetical protein
MVIRRRVVALAAVVAIAGGASVFAQKKDDKKRDDAQSKDFAAAVKLVDDIAAGTAQPANDLDLKWVRTDSFKAQNGKVFMPFVMTVDSSKVNGAVNFYWRVVSKSAAPTPTPAPAKNDKKDKDKPKQAENFPWEDFNGNLPLAAAGGGRIQRSFSVVPGSYDVYVVAQEPSPAQPVKGAPPQKVSALKETVDVPAYWNDDLNTSSVILAQTITPLAAPLSAQQLVDRPYAAFQSIEIAPTLDYKLQKTGEIHIFFFVYNPKVDANSKPSVNIEYNFYTKSGGAEKFFNKTPMLALNASTLPPQFNMAAGHQLQGGQDIPLGSFPVGDYRLEIKVTDTLATKTITRDVNFSVN